MVHFMAKNPRTYATRKLYLCSIFLLGLKDVVFWIANTRIFKLKTKMKDMATEKSFVRENTCSRYDFFSSKQKKVRQWKFFMDY